MLKRREADGKQRWHLENLNSIEIKSKLKKYNIIFLETFINSFWVLAVFFFSVGYTWNMLQNRQTNVHIIYLFLRFIQNLETRHPPKLTERLKALIQDFFVPSGS